MSSGPRAGDAIVAADEAIAKEDSQQLEAAALTLLAIARRTKSDGWR